MSPTKAFAALVLDIQPYSTDRYIRYNMYDATDGLDGGVCSGVETKNDLILSSSNTKCAITEDVKEEGHEPRTWETKVARVPAGSKRVIIVAQQRAKKGERHYGNVGVSHIRFAKPSDSDPGNPAAAIDTC